MRTTKQIPHSTRKSACCPARSTRVLPVLTQISYLRFNQRSCRQDLDYQNSQTFSKDSFPLLGTIPSLHPIQHHLGLRLATCSIFAMSSLTTPSISSIRRIRAFQSSISYSEIDLSSTQNSILKRQKKTLLAARSSTSIKRPQNKLLIRREAERVTKHRIRNAQNLERFLDSSRSVRPAYLIRPAPAS